MSKPRPYQQEAIDCVFKEWEESSSTLVVCPVGCGKTHIFAGVIAGVIKRMAPGRTLVIAHREELIFQARAKIMEVAGLECSIEKAELLASTHLFNRTPVVVASIQTLISGGDRKRMQRFNPMEFSCIVIDEAHHATAKSYRDAIKYFMEGNPNLKLLGVTATPDRADEQALGQIFQTVAFDYEVLDAIHDGYLVPVEQQMVTVEGLDFSNVKTTAGDLNGADLAAIMENEKNMQGVAGSSIEIIGDRRSIVFTASVKQAENVCEIFNRHRPFMAEWICGKTDQEERRKTLERFSRGEVQVVCNVGVLTEGYDNPGVECILMARPTKSRSLYAQCVGRGMRPLNGVVDGEVLTREDRKSLIAGSPKPACLVVDFVGNSGRHKLMTTADILGGKVSDAAIARAIQRAKDSTEPVNMSQILDEEENEIQEEHKRRIMAEQARRAKLVARVRYTSNRINPFDAMDISPAAERGWDSGKILSEKQSNLLMSQGIDPRSLPYAQSKQLLNELFRRWNNKLCTMKQSSLLKNHGYETRDLTMKDASKLIDALAKNGWRRPDFNGVAEGKL